MSKLLVAVKIFTVVADAIVIVDYVRLKLWPREDEGCAVCAESAAAALSNDSPIVNGVSMPSPRDARWVQATQDFIVRDVATGKDTAKTEVILQLGTGASAVVVSLLSPRLFIGVGPPALTSAEEKRYCALVIAAYKQRLVDKALS